MELFNKLRIMKICDFSMVLLFISIVVLLKIQLISGDDCQLVSGKTGVRLPLKSCHVLIELIGNLQKPLPKDVGLLLKDSFFMSWYNKTTVTVCCPYSHDRLEEDNGKCSMQFEKEARCVSFAQCPPFSLMLSNLRKPYPEAISVIMKEVYLCGVDEATGISIPKICCPSDAVTSLKLKPSIPQVDPNLGTTPPTANLQHLSLDNKYANHPGFAHLGNQDLCGRSIVYRRIVGGTEAELGQYPWLVNLGYTNEGKAEVEFKCGGSLLGPHHVLTAAHCVTGLPDQISLTTVRVGEHDLTNTEPDCHHSYCAPIPQDFQVEQKDFIVHPDYNKPERHHNDIAIIKLNKSAIETDYVSYICLPFGDAGTKDLTGKVAEVAGWGATDFYATKFSETLQYVTVPLTDFDECANFYKRSRVVLTDTQLCAGGEKGKDSCSGDSGSALMLEYGQHEYDPRSYQIGIVSFGPRRCATKGVMGVYTKVVKYLDWILDNLE